MKTVKAIKKTFVVLLITAVIVVASSIISAFLFKDALINHFIREANKQLNTPIHIDKISVSALDNFPRVSLNFDHVYIEESFEKSSYPLIEAQQIAFTFNPLDIYRGNYTIEQVHIKKAKCYFKVNANGTPNYAIFKKAETDNAEKVKLDLSKVTLHDVSFKYNNEQNETFLEILANNTNANIGISDKVYSINAKGDYLLKNLSSNGSELLSNKELSLETSLTYDDEIKNVDFKQSKLFINNATFLTYGNYSFSDIPEIEFYIEGKDTNIQTLISLLPEEQIKNLSKYESKGDVYFDLSLKGKINRPQLPALQINFGFINAELLYPDKGVRITKANAEGIFKANNLNDLNKGKLTLNNIGGALEGQEFSGNLDIINLNDPYINMDFDGLLSMKSLVSFLDRKDMNVDNGELQVNLTLNGRVNDLKKKSTANKVKTSGEIDINNLSFTHQNFELPVQNINGNLIFNNNDLAISDVSGQFGSSDFLLNGFFKNIIAFLLFKDEPVGIEADLKSNYINLDELLAHGTPMKSNSPVNYSFSISPRLLLNFNCDVNNLHFRRFKPKNIKGDLKIKHQVAFTDLLEFDAMGGHTAMSGLVNATDTTAFDINSNFTVNNVNIDSIFYVFENFNQTFLEDRHLKGKIQAEVNTEMILNNKLRLKPETLTASITTSIKGGELNNFEPMQKLARYVDEKKLDHLVFSDLKNEIHVQDKIIYLPEMEVSSNVTDIKIGGTHTFDQKIDYRVIAPLRSQQKIDSDEAFGAIEKDNSGRSMLYLRIIGSTDDYKIVYDKESVKKKIANDIKKEVDELKKAFKNKGLEKNKTLELEEDDYFDWDNDGS